MTANLQFYSVGFHMYIKTEDFIGYTRKVYFPGGSFNGRLVDIFFRSTILRRGPVEMRGFCNSTWSCVKQTLIPPCPGCPFISNTVDYCFALLVGVSTLLALTIQCD